MYLTDHRCREHNWTRATVIMCWNPSLAESVLRSLLPWLPPIFMGVWPGCRFVLARHGAYLLTNFGSETLSQLSKTRLGLDCPVVWCPPTRLSVLLSITQARSCTEACPPPSLFPFTQVFPLIKSFHVLYCPSLRGELFQITWKRSKLIGDWRCLSIRQDYPLAVFSSIIF